MGHMGSTTLTAAPRGTGAKETEMNITKITIRGLNAANMGPATDSDAAGYRQWLAAELEREFPGAEVETVEADSTRCTEVEVESEDDYDAAIGAVQEFVEDALGRCNWEWVTTPTHTGKYQVEANGHVFGIYEADTAQAARDLCAIEAGYKSEADMVDQLERASELIATEV